MRRNTVWLIAGLVVFCCCLLVTCVAATVGYFIWKQPDLPWRRTPVAYPSARPTPGGTRAPHLTPGQQTARPRPTPGGDGSETARRLAETTLPPRDLVEIAGRIKFGGEIPPRTVPPDGRPYTEGREDRFWVSDPALDTEREIDATLRLVTPHLYMYVETGKKVDESALEDAGRIFEDRIYPTNRRVFGSEWTPGVDGDPHIVILHASFEGASGYYSSQDEVPRQVNSHSNQHEMFYMNLDEMDVGDVFYLSTLAHEFQHMISWYQDPRADGWVDEGLSQMAEQVNGFDAASLAWTFLMNPDVQLTTWSDDDNTLAHYAASYLWFRYFTDRVGQPEAVRPLMDPTTDSFSALERELNQAGYQPVVSAPRVFDAFFADWAAANYLNDPSVGDGRYAYGGGLQLDSIGSLERVSSLPWQTTATVSPYATDYVEVDSHEKGTLRITFDGEETLPLVATSPHSGAHFWWSNRGDMGDSSLTQAFDLSGVSRATLRYWLWYDIEDDYDYAYVEASPDGGRSWSLLAAPGTTTSDPNGANLGHGYSGNSGGGEDPRWIQEEVDLSAYAGRKVLIRFEMITDDALNMPGLALDDLEIPEIGFSDSMETEAGWESSGFVWVDNVVPLHFLVQVVSEDRSGSRTVQALPLDEDRRGELLLPNYGRDISKVVLVISTVAPATTEPAAYQIDVTLE